MSDISANRVSTTNDFPRSRLLLQKTLSGCTANRYQSGGPTPPDTQVTACGRILMMAAAFYEGGTAAGGGGTIRHSCCVISGTHDDLTINNRHDRPEAKRCGWPRMKRGRGKDGRRRTHRSPLETEELSGGGAFGRCPRAIDVDSGTAGPAPWRSEGPKRGVSERGHRDRHAPYPGRPPPSYRVLFEVSSTMLPKRIPLLAQWIWKASRPADRRAPPSSSGAPVCVARQGRSSVTVSIRYNVKPVVGKDELVYLSTLPTIVNSAGVYLEVHATFREGLRAPQTEG